MQIFSYKLTYLYIFNILYILYIIYEYYKYYKFILKIYVYMYILCIHVCTHARVCVHAYMTHIGIA